MLGIPRWALPFAVVGASSTVGVVLNLFSRFGARPGKLVLDDECPIGTAEFLLAMSGVLNAPLHRGGTARLLNNGDEFYPAMLEAIRGAESTINFTTYIWKAGRVSDAFFDALTEAARAGREVRVLIDGIGGMRAPRERIGELEAAGGVWRTFNPIQVGKLMRVHRRTHRRALVVDGQIGFTGGAAVMDKWAGDARGPEEWRDCMVEVRGRLALSLQSAFTQLWAQATGELLGGAEFYPRRAHESHAVGEEVEGEPIRRHISVISSPSRDAHPIRHLHWLSIHSARRYVYITNSYFVPDRLLLRVLEEQARRGVDVRVLLPNEHNDVPLIRWASHSYYDRLLAAGVRIYEYQPTMIHQKLLVADDAWCLVGSANMDVRSKELNQENALGILDEGFAAEIRDTFLADLEHAREITLEEWRQRPAVRKLPERFFRLFEEQY